MLIKKLSIIVVVLLFVLPLCAQDRIDSIKLNDFYTGPLPAVLKLISTQHNVKFDYDSASLSTVSVVDRPFDKPLRNFLNQICKKHELQYFVDGELIIHIMLKVDDKTDVTTLKGFTNNVPLAKGTATKYNFTMSGEVVDATNGEKLPYANIYVSGTQTGTQSNANGFFSFTNVPNDTVLIEVSFIGYKLTYLRLTPDTKLSDIRIEMSPISTAIYEVVITADKDELMRMNYSDGINVVKVSPKQLDKLPNIGEKDVMRSLQLMPGVGGSNESSSGLYVRGGTPDQNLVLYDGFTVYQVDHLYGFFSAFNSHALKDVQLYKGGFESTFGGRLSSVTEITGKDGSEKYFNMGGEISLLGFNAFVESPLGKKITFLAAARRSYKGPIYEKIFNRFNEQEEEEDQPRGGPGMANNQTQAKSFFYDVNAKITFKPTSKDAISLSFFNGTDKLDNGFDFGGGGFPGGGGNESIDVSNTDLTTYGNTGVSLRWNRKWSDRLFGYSLLTYSYFYGNRDRTNSVTITDSLDNETTQKFGIIEDNKLHDISLQTNYTYELGKSNQLGFGAFGSKLLVHYTYSQNDTATILNKEQNGTVAGFYLQDKLKIFNKKLLLTPGLRTTYFSETGKVYLEPRFSLSYSIRPNLVFRAAFGKYNQYINKITREDIISGSKDFWLLSNNSNIPVSSAYHYIAGMSYDIGKYLFSVEGYYKTMDGLSEYSLRFNNGGREESGYEENFFNGIGNSKGVEFLVQKKSGKLNGWVSYTLSQTRYQFDVYGKSYFAASHDVTNELKAVVIYQYKKFNFSATWIYATGKPYTAPAGAYTVTLLDGTTSDYFVTSDKNSLRLPDYHRLDLAVNYTLSSKDKEREIGSIGVSVFNLYNRKNVWYKQYSIVDSQISETNVNYLGLTPNITLSLKLR